MDSASLRMAVHGLTYTDGSDFDRDWATNTFTRAGAANVFSPTYRREKSISHNFPLQHSQAVRSSDVYSQTKSGRFCEILERKDSHIDRVELENLASVLPEHIVIDKLLEALCRRQATSGSSQNCALVEHTDLSQQNRALRDELSHIRHRDSSLRAELSRPGSQDDILSDELSDSPLQSNDCEDELSQSQRRIDELSTALLRSQREIARLSEKNAALEIKLTEATGGTETLSAATSWSPLSRRVSSACHAQPSLSEPSEQVAHSIPGEEASGSGTESDAISPHSPISRQDMEHSNPDSDSEDELDSQSSTQTDYSAPSTDWLDDAGSIVVDRAMIVFETVFNMQFERLERASGILGCPSGEERLEQKEERTLGQSVSTFRSSKFLKGSNRDQVRRQSHENDGRGDSDDEDPKDGAGSKSRERKGLKSHRKFACPFFKHNPNIYQQRRSCPGPGWDTVHRLKEHLYRCHSLPPRCDRCGEIFDDEQLLAGHHRAIQSCELKQFVIGEGISSSQMEQLRSKKRIRPEPSEKEKWEKVYRILFPSHHGQYLPSPYYETTEQVRVESEPYHDFLRNELPLHMRQQIAAEVAKELSSSNESGPKDPKVIQQEILKRLPDIVRLVHRGLYRIYAKMPSGVTAGSSCMQQDLSEQHRIKADSPFVVSHASDLQADQQFLNMFPEPWDYVQGPSSDFDLSIPFDDEFAWNLTAHDSNHERPGAQSWSNQSLACIDAVTGLQ